MSRPLNIGLRKYVVFYKEPYKPNPVKKDMTYKNSIFNIIEANTCAEALIIARKKYMYEGVSLCYIPYHARKYNVDEYPSIDTLKKLKNYLNDWYNVSRET